MDSAVSIALDNLDWQHVDSKLKKKVMDGERMTVTRYSFGPGGRFPHHVHDQEQVTFVLSGDITFVIEDIHHDLAEGSLVIIPPARPHSATAGTDGAEVLSVVSPARTEGRGISLLEEA